MTTNNNNKLIQIFVYSDLKGPHIIAILYTSKEQDNEYYL